MSDRSKWFDKAIAAKADADAVRPAAGAGADSDRTERCMHGVWSGDHCYQCAAGAGAPSRELLVNFFRHEESEWGEKGDYNGWSPERSAIELIRHLRAALTNKPATNADSGRSIRRANDDGLCDHCDNRDVTGPDHLCDTCRRAALPAGAPARHAPLNLPENRDGLIARAADMDGSISAGAPAGTEDALDLHRPIDAARVRRDRDDAAAINAAVKMAANLAGAPGWGTPDDVTVDRATRAFGDEMRRQAECSIVVDTRECVRAALRSAAPPVAAPGEPRE